MKNMQNKKLIILIILGMGAIASLIYGMMSPSGTERRRLSPKPEGTLAGKERILKPAEITPQERGAKRTGYPYWGRSPFLPPEKPEAKAEEKIAKLNLGGIVGHEGSYRAIINDVMVGKGSKIGGYTVVDIKEDRVILNDGLNIFELRMRE